MDALCNAMEFGNYIKLYVPLPVFREDVQPKNLLPGESLVPLQDGRIAR